MRMKEDNKYVEVGKPTLPRALGRWQQRYPPLLRTPSFKSMKTTKNIARDRGRILLPGFNLGGGQTATLMDSNGTAFIFLLLEYVIKMFFSLKTAQVISSYN